MPKGAVGGVKKIRSEGSCDGADGGMTEGVDFLSALICLWIFVRGRAAATASRRLAVLPVCPHLWLVVRAAFRWQPRPSLSSHFLSNSTSDSEPPVST